MRTITIELPDELERQVETAAKLDQKSEAEIVRDAVEEAMRKRARPKPRIPLFRSGLLPPDLAENVDEYLKGFGE
jgi:Arc/MetJ-type ribon-helix-helix transcriptional regulator